MTRKPDKRRTGGDRSSPHRRAGRKYPAHGPQRAAHTATDHGAAGLKGTLFYGQHAVLAALANPKRKVARIFVTDKGRAKYADAIDGSTPIEGGADIFSWLESQGVNHQGLAADVLALSPPSLDILQQDGETGHNMVLILDQVTDPQNIGACLRSAAAFGVSALITQDRNSPSESGALAKAASGALEHVGWIRVTNIAQTILQLKDYGYWCTGLDGSAQQDLVSVDRRGAAAVVMGSEGRGLRPLVAKACDTLVRIPMTGAVESLNVSAAAAVVLHSLAAISAEDH